jgi:predicted XRE-type DNA-binding protein
MKKTAEKKRGSVFHDLGFSPAEAENLRIRAAMMSALIDAIEVRKLNQAQAAKLLGVTQPRISDLTRGKIRLFSIDTLVKLLAAAGMKVNLRVTGAACVWLLVVALFGRLSRSTEFPRPASALP